MLNASRKKRYKIVNGRKAHFCIPADFNVESLKKFAKLNAKYKHAKIEEVYGNLSQSSYGSGRSSTSIAQIGFSELEKYVINCKKYKIEFNYTFNASTIGNREFNEKGRKEILLFIKKLHDIGIRRFTITLPSLVSLINNNFNDVDIVLSVINGIADSYQLKELLDAGKVARVYVAEDLNRKPKKLREIAINSKVPIATILNTFCLFECAYRFHHYNFIAFRDKNDKVDVIEYYGTRCSGKTAGNPNEVIKIPWVRPVDIDKYIDMGVHLFKIAGRETVNAGADLSRAVEAYMSGVYEGDLIDLFNNFSDKRCNRIFSLDSKSLDQYFNYIFSKQVDCSRDLCKICGMCEKYSNYVVINKQEAKQLPKFSLLK
jgi:collagenase-like PrtC family protease